MTLLRSSVQQLSRGRLSPSAQCVLCSYVPTRQASDQGEGESDAPKSDSWFGKLLRGDPTQVSSSVAVGKANELYRLVFVRTKPEYTAQFIEASNKVLPAFAKSEGSCRLLAAWRTMIGDSDEIIHLWQYRDGYKSIDEMGLSVLPNDEVFQQLRSDTLHMIQSQRSEIAMQFGFWDSPVERPDKHVYDLRTYRLKPGTMIEWANHWATGIEARKTHNQDVAGLFTHIGELYTVHHIWAYKSFQDRKKIREASWNKPGWSQTVANTVPLIKSVNSRIMTALPYSNLK